MRSILTLLGITIGVFAVITLSSTVHIVKSKIKSEMKDLGWNNSITIYASSGSSNLRYRRRHFARRMSRFMYLNRKSSPLTMEDFEMISNKVPSKYCYATISDYSTVYHNKKDYKTSMIATNYDYFLLKKYKIISGRFFTDFENAKHLKVCILSQPFAKKLSTDTADLVGKYIKIDSGIFKVVGISQVEKEKSSFVNMGNSDSEDEPIFLPLSTGVFYLRSSSKVDNIYIQANSPEDYANMKNSVRQLLLAKHNMSHDFQFADIGSFMMKINKEIDAFMKKWSVLFITIASVSLFVGGIGLFSTLFISIAERMNEIGVRKSIGAKNFDIFLLFISEALILALIAALMGLGLSAGLMAIVSKFLSQTFAIPLQGILIGFGFSIIIGFLSGLYPAIKAARVNPTEAIYYFQ